MTNLCHKNTLSLYPVIFVGVVIGLCYSTLSVASNSATHIEFDGSTGTSKTTVNGDINNVFTIDSTDGSGQSGSNLFHSFKEFSIGNGDTANFTDSSNSSFGNVILRVTGGNESLIFGKIQLDPTTLKSANLFLLNPTGIVFGEGASIDIGGSFYASTADQLIFDSENNEVMPTGTTSSTFYSADVEAFGFINPNPVSITVSDVSLVVEPGESISLIGGDISLSGATLEATNGTIQIASVTGQDNVPVNIFEYEPMHNTVLGDITMSNAAQINTSGTRGGQIVIRGGNLAMLESSSLTNNISDTSQAATDQAGIDISVSGDINLDDQAKISANSVIDDISGKGATSRSDGIKIEASNLSLSDGSVIESTMEATTQVSDVENHHEGLIDIKIYDTIDIKSNSSIGTVNSGSGDAAAIDVRADTLRLTDGGIIDASAYFKNATGYGGDVSIDVNSLQITGSKEIPAHSYKANKNTGIQSNGANRRAATRSGSIDVKAQRIVITDNGIIQANSYGEIQGADINLVADNGSIELLNGGRVQSKGKGTAGNISLVADNITISGATFKDGSLKIQRSGITNANNTSDSTSGNIFIESKKITLSNGARIDTFSSQGQSGGNIIISADEIHVSGLNQGVYEHELGLRKDQDSEKAKQTAMESATTSIVTKPNAASDVYNDETAGGNIILAATTFDITDNARIITQTLGLAKGAGNIDIRANDISIQNNSYISTEQNKTLADSTNRPNGNISLVANNNLVIENSEISTTVNSPNGKGGDIFLSSNKLLLNGVTLDSSAKLGNGGNITVVSSQSIITPDTVFIANSESAINGIIDIQNLSQDLHNINYTPIVRQEISITQVSACDLNKSVSSSTLFVGTLNETRSVVQYGDMNLYSIDLAIGSNHLLQTPFIVAQYAPFECRQYVSR